MSENYNSLDPVIRYAEEKGVIAMPGGGFDGPEWTLRFSLANSSAETFEEVRILGYQILEEYYKEYKKR
jgi:aspartate 4-decarboxylase